MRSTLLTAVSLLFLPVAACGQEDGRTADAGSDHGDTSEMDETDPQVILADFLAENGRDLDACFKDLPDVGTVDGAGEFEGAVEPAGPEDVLRRVVVAVDASGSMAGQIRGQTKMDAAKAAARDFLANIPADVEIGLVAFGHKGNNNESGKTESCEGVETIREIGVSDEADIAGRLSAFSAVGWTPLASAIETAGAAFTSSDVEGEQVVYIVSDGEETCGGDPVEAARALHESDVRAVINIIGFDLAEMDRQQLQAVAEAGGGVFTEADTGEELAAVAAENARRAANYQEINQTRARNYGQINENRADTYGAINALKACVYDIKNNETADFYRKANNSDWPPDSLKDEVRRLLDDRHDEAVARMKALNDAARSNLRDANAVMEDNLADAEDRLDEAMSDQD